MGLIDDNVPLGDEVFHVEVHLLVVLGLKLQLLYIDLLKQVIDVNLLDSTGDLSLQFGILLFQLCVFFDQPSIVRGQLLLLNIQHLVLGVQLGVFDPLLDDIISVVGVGLSQNGQVFLEIK